jgi:hypothetical protein
MKLLDESFRREGLLYKLLKRNEAVALYGIGGHFSDEVKSYEVDKIYIRKDIWAEDREHIPSNELFGKDRSRWFPAKEQALDYFDELTIKLKQAPRVLKAVTGVREAA